MNIATSYLLFLGLGVALAVPIVNSLTDDGLDKRELALRPRLISAGWFAIAACVPIGLFWLILGRVLDRIGQDGTHVWPAALWVFCGLPILAAAFCGFTRGARILDPLVVRTSFESVHRGFIVGLLSYLIFSVALLTMVLIYADRPTRRSFLIGTVVVVAVGAVLIGWLVVLSTSLAGWLLYRLSRVKRFQRQLGSSLRVSRSVAISWTVAAMIVFHICSMPGSLSFGATVKRELLKFRNRELLQAIQYDNADRVESLLGEGADVMNLDSGLTPLAIAAYDHHTQVMKVLLDHGADPNTFDPKSSFSTPLMNVVSDADFEATKMLVDHGADVNAPGQKGFTPLMEAARFGTPEIVSLLLAHGADLNRRNHDGDSNGDSDEGKTALGLAIARRDIPISSERSGDGDWEEAFVIARARKRHDEIIRILKAAGAKE